MKTQFDVRFDLDSYHRPHLCWASRWEQNATMLRLALIGVSQPRALFINDDNRIHVADRLSGKLVIWDKDNIESIRTLRANVSEHSDLFVGLNGDVYFEKRNVPGRIEKVPKDQHNSTFVAKFSGNCFGLFIDWNNDLYCSQPYQHKVTKISLNRENQSEIIVAGGCGGGSSQCQLHHPWGIFVDQHSNLFVADVDNHRIQRFRAGHRAGETVAGKDISPDLSLSYPTDVISDGNGHLYIVDSGHNRVVRSNGTFFQCIVGCVTPPGFRTWNIPTNVFAIHFDSEGHLYMASTNSDVIQKFKLVTNGCPKTRQSLLDGNPAFPPSEAETILSENNCSSGMLYHHLIEEAMNTSSIV